MVELNPDNDTPEVRCRRCSEMMSTEGILMSYAVIFVPLITVYIGTSGNYCTDLQKNLQGFLSQTYHPPNITEHYLTSNNEGR